ncbi:MAG: XdhC family protein [Deltaproteobacteria bacterium]|nr:XdhC family protein [Deltaproteobacteria bacterium]
MMSLEARTHELRASGEPYVMALVVRCEAPTSAKPGARGIVTRDGKITGWIGGGCAQPIVIEESQRALREGTPRLVRITPQAGNAEVNGINTYQMVCHSGGTLDIFIEPILPKPELIILGRSPVARTLALLAGTLGFTVRVHAPEARREEFPAEASVHDSYKLGELKQPHQTFVVVSTQGEDDEGGLLEALKTQARYVAFVSSPKKWHTVSEFLTGQGIDKKQLARVRVPAGVPIHAKEPEEIALSILAEIVSLRRSESPQDAPLAATPEQSRPPVTQAIDPICNMTVNIPTAKHISEYQGQKVYFCCAGCKQKFEANPGRYIQ